MVVESVLALNEESLRGQWEWIHGCLRDVLEEGGEKELAEMLPLSGTLPLTSSGLSGSVHLTQAYSIAFQLLGMAEQNAADHFRKSIERKSGLDALPALWGDSLRQLAKSIYVALALHTLSKLSSMGHNQRLTVIEVDRHQELVKNHGSDAQVI